MSVAPHAGIVDFGTFTPPTSTKDGIQGEVPQPLQGEQDYVLTASGWVALSSLGTLVYQGTWDASTNTPTLVSSVGTQGYYYVVSVAGNTDLNGITTWTVGDWALFNGSVWQKIEGGSTVDITGGQINNTVIGNNTPAAGTFTTLTATGQTSLGGAAGAEGLRVLNAASTVNWVQAQGSTTGNQPFLWVGGANTNIALGLSSKGNGNINFFTNGGGNAQLVAAHTASAVNYVQVTGAATGGGVSVTAQGSDSNVFLDLKSKGSYPITFYTGTTAQFTVAHTASAVNRLQVTGAAAGSAPVLSSFGSDTNIDLTLTPKGTGTVVANGPFTATGQTSLGGAAGSESFRATVVASQNRYVEARGGVAGSTYPAVGVGGGTEAFGVYSNLNLLRFNTQGYNTGLQMAVSHTASAVNYVQVTGGATGNNTTISTQGSDGSIGLTILTRGTSATGSLVSFASNLTQTNYTFRIAAGSTANANYLQVAPAATTASPVLSAQGSDTNISQVFQSKGTGAIDLAAGSSGVNISNGGTVTAITRTVAGTGYTSPPTVAITAPTTAGGVQATASAFLQLAVTPTITSGGTGYSVNDVLTFSGGTIGLGATASAVTVTSVSGGVITGISINQFGTGYSTVPTSPISVTGGTGTGATFTVSGWQVSAFTITNAGSGYVEQPTVSFSGGGGSGAAAYARIGSDVTVKGLGTNLDFSTPNGTGLRVLDGGQTSAAYWSVGGGANAVFRTVGNASAYFDNNNAQPLIFRTATSSEQFRVSHTASAVNYVQVTGSPTGVTAATIPSLSVQGSDSTTYLGIGVKGTGYISFHSGTTNNQVFRINTANAATNANRIEVNAAPSGSSPSISVAGGTGTADTNIDLALIPKGTGNVRFGTYTGTALSIAGYIEIKDAGGTVRKLAVVA